jgi:copper homeostasis protein CutC
LHAVDSLDALRKWNLATANRLEILPAGGIHSLNAQRVLQETHCRQLHGSFTKRPEQASESRFSSLLPGMPIVEEIFQVRRLLDRSNLASMSS